MNHSTWINGPPSCYCKKLDSSGVIIKCPYDCAKGAHYHGYTAPIEGVRNTRVAHCGPVHDDTGKGTWRQYRILFPYEDEAIAQGYWFMLDRHACQWKTIGWGLRSPGHDVEDDIEVATSGDEEEDEEKDEEEEEEKDEEEHEEEAAEDDEEEDAEEEDKEEGKERQDKRDSSVVIAPGNTVDSSHRHARSQVACNDYGGNNSLALRFSSLSLQSSREKQLLDSFCVTNDVANLQGMLNRNSDPLTLIESQESSLIATCEEGHGEVVATLLDYGVSLTAKDRYGDTALQKAINAGFGSIGLRLIEAGANITGIDSKGSTLLNAAGEMLKRQKELIGLDRLCLANALGEDYEEEYIDRVQTRLSRRDAEVSALMKVICYCEASELQWRAEAELKRVELLHGIEQATHVDRHGTFDHALIIRRVLDQIFDTPRDTGTSTRVTDSVATDGRTYIANHGNYRLSGW